MVLFVVDFFKIQSLAQKTTKKVWNVNFEYFQDNINESNELINGILNADYLQGSIADIREQKKKIDELRELVSYDYAEIVSGKCAEEGCNMQWFVGNS